MMFNIRQKHNNLSFAYLREHTPYIRMLFFVLNQILVRYWVTIDYGPDIYLLGCNTLTIHSHQQCVVEFAKLSLPIENIKQEIIL